MPRWARASSSCSPCSQTGFGKRTSSYEYRVTGRGGSGIVAMGMGKKNSAIIAAFPVEESDDLMLISDQGQTIRVPVSRHFASRAAPPRASRCSGWRRANAWSRWSASRKPRGTANEAGDEEAHRALSRHLRSGDAGPHGHHRARREAGGPSGDRGGDQSVQDRRCSRWRSAWK